MLLDNNMPLKETEQLIKKIRVCKNLKKSLNKKELTHPSFNKEWEIEVDLNHWLQLKNQRNRTECLTKINKESIKFIIELDKHLEAVVKDINDKCLSLKLKAKKL